MTIESITDENYKEFRESPRSALVITTSWCKHCATYEPVLQALSKKMPYVRWGKTVIDKDRSSQLKRDYNDISSWKLPTTLLFRDEKEVSRIGGSIPYPDAISKVQENLVLGSTVYVSNGKGYLPGKIKHIRNGGLYIVQLANNKTQELPEEKFEWGLESKV